MDPSRILIVEDDPLISSHLETIVETETGSDVVVSATVADAVTALETDVHFALLDVDVLDGKTYSFASRLSSKDIPFAFVSASDRKEIPRALRDVPFVTKPYTHDDIVDLLQGVRQTAPDPADCAADARPVRTSRNDSTN